MQKQISRYLSVTMSLLYHVSVTKTRHHFFFFVFVYNSFRNLPFLSEIRHTLNIFYPYNRSWIDENPLSISPLKKNNSPRRNAGAVCMFVVTVHTPLSREVFWHENAKIPRHTARIYAISINSVHREACYWARSEQ